MVPFFFYKNEMATKTNIEIVHELLEKLLFDDIFLVEVKIKPTNNYKIYLDADSGLEIQNCTKINKALYKHMEAMELYPDGDFSLEVSSAGLDQPLKMLRQYQKNIGRTLEIVMLDGTEKEGLLTDVTETEITIEYTEGKGKKAVLVTLPVLLENIKETRVQIKF
jgi:ribosome maturation factor RimP